jgi:hypothetical protein
MEFLGCDYFVETEAKPMKLPIARWLKRRNK